jgi:hypothetical protein
MEEKNRQTHGDSLASLATRSCRSGQAVKAKVVASNEAVAIERR